MNLNSRREKPRQPKSRNCFGVGFQVDKVVNPLENQNNPVIKNFRIVYNLVVQLFIANAEPIFEVSPEFFLLKFDFLADV